MPPFPITAPQAGHYWGPNPANNAWVEIPIPAGMPAFPANNPTAGNYWAPNAAQNDWEEMPILAAPAQQTPPARNWRRLLGVIAAIVAIVILGWLAFGRDSSKSSTPPASTTPASTTPSTSTTSTGGGAMPSTTTGGSTPGTGSSATAAPSPCVKDDPAASAHGFTAAATLAGPVTDGGSATVQITVCKVSGEPVPMPAVLVGVGFDSQPTGNFAELNLPPGVYSWWDQNRNWFQPASMAAGSSFVLNGTVNIPTRGTPSAYTFCLFLRVSGLSEHPPYDSNGNPVPTWTEVVGPQASCWPYTVR